MKNYSPKYLDHLHRASLLDSKKIKLKELYGHFRLPSFTPDYDVEKLREDIKTNGLRNDRYIIVFKIITIINNKQCEALIETWPNIKYQLWDGNHRCFVLKELYGDDHEINVKIDDRPFTLTTNNLKHLKTQLVQRNRVSLAAQKKRCLTL